MNIVNLSLIDFLNCRFQSFIVVDVLVDLDPIAGSGIGRTAIVLGDGGNTTSSLDDIGER